MLMLMFLLLLVGLLSWSTPVVDVFVLLLSVVFVVDDFVFVMIVVLMVACVDVHNEKRGKTERQTDKQTYTQTDHFSDSLNEKLGRTFSIPSRKKPVLL